MTATDTYAPATMDDDFYLQYLPVVTRTAIREHRQSTIYSAEDIEQAIWEHVLKNWADYAGYDEGLVVSCINRAARTYVTQARIEHMYATGSFIYTPKLVAAYLATCAWEPLEEVPDVDARVDLQEAFALLQQSAPKQAEAVFRRYGMGETSLSEAEEKNVSRGVESLCHRLNSGLRLSSESIELASKEY